MSRKSELLSAAFTMTRYLIIVFVTVIQGYPQSAREIFRQEVSLPRQNSSIYSVLNQISAQSGYYFVYNTEILDSDKKVRIKDENKTISSWLEEIVDDPSVDYYIIENHILIYRPEKKEEPEAQKTVNIEKPQFFSIKGRVFDESSRKPLPFATIGVKGRPLGIITNADGVFSLRLPGEYENHYISVSHIGYKPKHVPVKLFVGNSVDILLETDYISIQEVMIRYYDPVTIIKSALEKTAGNYSNEPAYHINFYREGVMRNDRFINYSEAVFQVFKPPYNKNQETEQVKLLQSRTISNTDRSDTLILKIRAGVRSSLSLDFIKNIPEFLDLEFIDDYDFTNSDIISVDGQRAYAVAFEQKPHISHPLYRGIIYIETESLAFLGADFEVHPKYISKAQNQFIIRKSRNYRATLEKAAYTVNYRYYNGHYHLNHVRADLHLRYRKRYQIFSNNYHVFVEMATSRIETENVMRLSRKDSYRTDRVFVDGEHIYDPGFWSGYSIITPEENITRSLSRIESKIESIIAGRE